MFYRNLNGKVLRVSFFKCIKLCSHEWEVSIYLEIMGLFPHVSFIDNFLQVFNC